MAEDNGKKKSKRGGRREGAGRRVGIGNKLPEEFKERLRRHLRIAASVTWHEARTRACVCNIVMLAVAVVNAIPATPCRSAF